MSQQPQQPQQPQQRNLFDFFQDEARSAMQSAREEVARTKAAAFGPEHLLLGILKLEKSRAADALSDVGLSASDLAATVAESVPEGTADAPPEQIPFTPAAQQALQITLNAAGSLFHPSVGTDHLLVALLQDPAGPLSASLEKLKVDRNALGEALMTRLRAIPPDPKMQAQAQAAQAAQAQAQAQAQAGGGAGMAGMTPSAQRVLEAARTQARDLGHGQIGTVHLMLALLQDPDRMMANLFVNLRVRPEEVRGELLKVLRAEPATEAGDGEAAVGEAAAPGEAKA